MKRQNRKIKNVGRVPRCSSRNQSFSSPLCKHWPRWVSLAVIKRSPQLQPRLSAAAKSLPTIKRGILVFFFPSMLIFNSHWLKLARKSWWSAQAFDFIRQVYVDGTIFVLRLGGQPVLMFHPRLRMLLCGCTGCYLGCYQFNLGRILLLSLLYLNKTTNISAKLTVIWD